FGGAKSLHGSSFMVYVARHLFLIDVVSVVLPEPCGVHDVFDALLILRSVWEADAVGHNWLIFAEVGGFVTDAQKVDDQQRAFALLPIDEVGIVERLIAVDRSVGNPILALGSLYLLGGNACPFDASRRHALLVGHHDRRLVAAGAGGSPLTVNGHSDEF